MLQHHDTPETPAVKAPSAEVTGTEPIPLKENVASGHDSELMELAASLQASVDGSRRRSRTYMKVACALLAVGVVPLVSLYMALLAGPTPPSSEILSILMGGFAVMPTIIIGGVVWLRRVPSNAQERIAAEKLRHIDDPHAVGLLLDRVGEIYTAPLRPVLWQTLVRLLTQMQEDEIQQLGTERYGTLAFVIRSWDNPLQKMMSDVGNPFLLAALTVLTRCGQISFRVATASEPQTIDILPTLWRWAKGKGAGRDPEVQQAAIACRDAIEQRRALGRTGEQLLRASEPTPVGPDTLLRPTQGAPQTDPQELLRPDDPV
jgi:hypothetical protein